MHDNFKELVKISLELDPWVRERKIEGYLKDLDNEVKEAIAASKPEELRDELGDILYIIYHISAMAEEKGYFSIEDVFRSADTKLRTRKPYLLEGRKVTKEEAVRIWMEAKEKERKDKNADRQEFVFYVDEDDNILGRVTRKDSVLRNLWHRGTAIIVLNTKGEILVHKRAPGKDRFPGCYSMFFGGHVSYGESYKENAERELLEEAGIDAELQFLYHCKFESEETKSHTDVFRVVCDGPFSYQKEEIEEAFFVSPRKLRQMMKAEKFSPDAIAAYDIYLKHERQI